MIKLQPIAGSMWRLLLVLGFLALLLTCVLVFPKLLVNKSLNLTAATTQLTPVERLKAENDVRATLLQGMGGLVLLVGAIATWRQLYLSRQQLQHNIEAGRQQLLINREGQITERFTRSIEQLGSPNIDVQLGGIYALERIANESVGDRRSITEILTAFVRTHSPLSPNDETTGKALVPLPARLPAVQAAITVLGRRKAAQDETVEIVNEFIFDGAEIKTNYRTGSPLELNNVNLCKANLTNCNLIGANLANSNLEESDFFRTNLKAGNLSDTIVKRAKFDETNFEGTTLIGAHLEGANLSDALHLEKASLLGAWADLQTMWPNDFDWRTAGVKICSNESIVTTMDIDKHTDQSSRSIPD